MADRRCGLWSALSAVLLGGVCLCVVPTRADEPAVPPPSAESPPSRPGPSAGSGRAIALDALVQQLDRDGDGRVSRVEAVGAYRQRFADWDADGDGFATRDEIRRHRATLGIDDHGARTAGAAPGNPSGTPANRRAAGREATASLLLTPVEWRLETFPVPPPFAPTIALRGKEEARFAPGMYDTSSPEYFTYIVAFEVDGTASFGPAELQDLLEKYFRGLLAGRGRRSGITVDPESIRAAVAARAENTPVETPLQADLSLVDTFTDGRRTTLRIEAHVRPRPAENKTRLLLLLSPAKGDSATWTRLRELGRTVYESWDKVPAAGASP